MKKKHSIGRFTLIAVLCAIIAVLTIFSFRLPGSSKDYDFVGFARAINYGIEYRGGTVETYSANLKVQNNLNLQDGISNNATRIKYLLDNEGYETNVYQKGNDIVIELYDEYSPVLIEDIINLQPYFAIKTTQSDTAEEVVKPEDVDTCIATTSSGESILYITFTAEGAENFQKVIDNGTGYFYIGSNVFPISLSNANSSYVGIRVGSLDTARNYASTIVSSKYSFSFEKTGTVEYTKAEAHKNVIVLVCLTICLFVLGFALLVILFKSLGLVGGLILTIGLLLQIVLLQAIPETVFTFTSGALFASLTSFGLGFVALLMMFRSMHKEYKQGKILSASVKFGFNKVWAGILDMFVVLIVPTTLAYFFGSFVTKQIAMAFISGLAVYGFVTIVFTKFFAKWLTYIKFKNKDYGFKREANVNELK